MNTTPARAPKFAAWIKDVSVAQLRGGAAFARGAAAALGWRPGSPAERWIAIDAALVVLWSDERADRGAARTSDEEVILHVLRDALDPRTVASPSGRIWTNSVRSTVRAIYAPMPRTYGEHLVIGARSIALGHCVAALAIAGGTNLAARAGDECVRMMLHDFARGLRLDNDLRGVGREVSEDSRANAVVLLRPSLGQHGAREFVRDQRDRYLSSAHARLDRLGESDPVARLVRAALAGVQSFYETEQQRYASQPRRAA